VKMNAETAGWARRYQNKLRSYLKQKPGGDLTPAFELGNQAVALGLETLDLALVHGLVLVALRSKKDTFKQHPKIVDRAKKFFAEAVVPIEQTHSAALKNGIRVNQLIKTLRQRTSESSISTQSLNRGIARRQEAESALKISGQQRNLLLRESRRLQNRLLHQTHQILSAQENERRKVSNQLHKDIAQTLLAINLRLLTLKTSTKANAESLKKEIVNTQRMVEQFARKVKTVHL